MKKLNRGIVLTLLAIAAIFFYSMGNSSTLIVLLIIGFIFELAFWSKVFPRKNTPSKNQS
jgi:hypothetical protein